MSTIPTLVTQEMFHYLTSHAAPEDSLLANLKVAAAAQGVPDIWISSEQATFIQILLQIAKATQVVEVGTLVGYSAISMAQSLPDDGRLVSIEINEDYANFARKWVSKAGLQDIIDIRLGDATQVLLTLEDACFDAAFIDADKANYGVYLKECLRLLKPGGLMMIDNAFAFGKLLDEKESTDDVWAIRAFNDMMAREASVSSIIVPVGDGMWVGVKQAS